MKQAFQIVCLLFFFVAAPQVLLSQSDKDKALEKGLRAVKLMDKGKIDESIVLLQEAQKLDPGNIHYPYELAYAYTIKKDYNKAVKSLEGIINHKETNDLVYQLLGNSYDYLGKTDKAIQTYDAGLKKFPKSGPLHLERGGIEMMKKNYDKAISYYEKGIEVDPVFASNYYWAAKLYCNSSEEVWGVIYGEIFMNLERNSKRTAEMSKLLHDTYKQAINISSDTFMSVSFSQNMVLAPGKGNDFKMPFSMPFETTLLMALIGQESIDINSLSKIRENFLELFYRNGHEKKYPNVLFDYQNKIAKAGHLDAYNHWLLMKGDEDGFEKWEVSNKSKMEAFIDWYSKNPLQLSENHKFYRSQY